MSINLICALSKNNIIGINNKLPWNISEDLKRFKDLTSENWIVMGRKTFDSIGRPLPNRRNVILSENLDLKISGAEVLHSPQEVLNLYYADGDKKDLFVIGGTFIYEIFIKHCDYLNITYIDKEYEGDSYFPEINWNEWSLEKEVKSYDKGEKADFYFRDFKRI